MKEIKCSRCHRKVEVEPDYPFKECPKCHSRTQKRFPSLKAKLRNYPKHNFQERVFQHELGKPLSKQDYIKLRGFKDPYVAERDYEVYLREQAEKRRFLKLRYQVDKFPLHPKKALECLKCRDAVLNQNPLFPLDLDALLHMEGCLGCREFERANRYGKMWSDESSETEFFQTMKQARSEHIPTPEEEHARKRQLYEAFKEPEREPQQKTDYKQELNKILEDYDNAKKRKQQNEQQ